jgi:hypothetical protein
MSYAFPKTLRTLLALAVTLALANVAGANQSYGNLVGPNIMYLGISEVDTQLLGPPAVNSTPAQLFGAPVLSPPGSNTMAFPGLSFSLAVANGQFGLQDGKLTMDIAPSNPQSFIQSLTFDEGGAWRVLGAQGGATAEATLLFNDLRITSTNGVPLPTAIVVNPAFSVNSVTQNGSAQVINGNGDITFVSTGGNAVGTWNILANFDLAAALAANGRAGQRITGMSLSLDNQLFAQTQQLQGLTLASIDKKHFFISSTIVPEPSTILLGLMGGVGILVCGRRLKKAKTA